MLHMNTIADNAEKIREISEIFTVKGELFLEMIEKEVENGVITAAEANSRSAKMLEIQKEMLKIEMYADEAENLRRIKNIYVKKLEIAQEKYKALLKKEFIESRNGKEELRAKKTLEIAQRHFMERTEFEAIEISPFSEEYLIEEDQTKYRRRRSRSIGAVVKRALKTVKRRLSAGREKTNHHCE